MSRPSSRRRVQHPGAIAIFIAPFAALFTLFYLLPVAYAVW